VPEAPKRLHLLAPDVKCPACGAGLTFIRLRTNGDLYRCASGGLCKCYVIHYRKGITKICGLLNPSQLWSVWQVDRVRYARGEGVNGCRNVTCCFTRFRRA
jgi:hypothetical protein